MQTLDEARRDLAYLHAVVADRGPMPVHLGWHMIVLGAVFAVAFLHIWSVYAGLSPWPVDLRGWLWAPGAVAYAGANLIVRRLCAPEVGGPGARVFSLAWMTTAIVTPPAVLVLFVAGGQLDLPLYKVWPALALVLYGGSWALIALIRSSRAFGALAACCFAAAALAAGMVDHTGQWLVMVASLLLLVGAPGAVIVILGRRKA